MSWYPHVTVATLVEKEGLFLLVEEKKQGQLLLNQPAGHLEQDETLFEAAIRETLEETQWRVELKALLGNSLFTSPANGITYLRTSFIAEPIELDTLHPLDSDIERAVWLSPMEVKKNQYRLRSPMVINDIDRFLKGESYPLELITHIQGFTPSI
ncbi:NUDIX hydrolase [Teredinibacter haidensis]|uniref:NUDIX hydrolase n=1 Tax=Teredinibacter haidensis TaxID=2731755 RepID=UPI000948BA56|nr:NUDIX hydrolase [Teredinibacter haidensis]